MTTPDPAVAAATLALATQSAWIADARLRLTTLRLKLPRGTSRAWRGPASRAFLATLDDLESRLQLADDTVVRALSAIDSARYSLADSDE